MTAGQLIDKCYEQCKPYPYAKIWRLHSGTSYKSLPKHIKSCWREHVNLRAEYGRDKELPPPIMYTQNLYR